MRLESDFPGSNTVGCKYTWRHFPERTTEFQGTGTVIYYSMHLALRAIPDLHNLWMAVSRAKSNQSLERVFATNTCNLQAQTPLKLRSQNLHPSRAYQSRKYFGADPMSLRVCKEWVGFNKLWNSSNSHLNPTSPGLEPVFLRPQ